MKKKTINAVIAKKMNEWWDTITDEELRKKVKRDTIVTGGCIASMLLKEKINDFDVYFRTRETTIAVAEYYLARFSDKLPLSPSTGEKAAAYVDTSREDRVGIYIKSAGVVGEGDAKPEEYDYFEGRRDEAAGNYVSRVMDDPGEIQDEFDALEEAVQQAEQSEPEKYRPVFMSTNAITLSGKVQIIIRFYGTPEEIHGNYDYVHATNYWTRDSGTVLNMAAMESLMARELRYVGSLYPVCSIIRLRKFIRRGWTINAGQMLKIMLQLSQLDLSDPEVLRDQLTGVDAAYFAEVMTKAKEKDPERINQAYLIEIIDRMF